ncbi:MAG: hypothetical protein ABJA98_29160 [Acidobacteriota bacterium]
MARTWGLVCGSCTPAVVTMIDGRIDGDEMKSVGIGQNAVLGAARSK